MQLLVNIDVADLEKGIVFYEKGLGLQLKRRPLDGTGAEMVGGLAVTYLIEDAGNSVAVPESRLERNYSRHWTPVHVDFVVEDTHVSVIRAASAGAKQEGEIQSYSWGLLTPMSEPFGHGFCLLQFVGKGYEHAE